MGVRMSYNETLQFLYTSLPAYHRIGRAAYKNNLDNTLALDNYFGHPHTKYRTVHIAGTNGKGSLAHMIASVLMEAGQSTGLYTSPHLKDFRERIMVDGRMIPKRYVTGFVGKHRGIIDRLKPSFFEMTVAMAFKYFADSKVDVAVIETGMGGRLDSTNIIMPLFSLITNTGHDHMEFLGDTLEKVAFEKAGIIKPGVPVVIGETQAETRSVFVSRANEAGSPVFFADDNFTCILEEAESKIQGRKFTVNNLTEESRIEGFTPLGGDYQKKNLQTLFQAVKLLDKHLNISNEALIRGIAGVVKNTGIQGRWQILSTNPLTICDTGHNLEGLEFVMSQIGKIPASSLHMVIGFVNDKDLDSILPLFPRTARYYFTRAVIVRAMDENILKSKASEYGLYGESYPDVSRAFAAARNCAVSSDLIFVGGSTFVVAEVI